MPAESKNQLNFFKLVKAFKEGQESAFYKEWHNLFKYRPLPEEKYILKIKQTAERMSAEDLEDKTSGIKGDNMLGDQRDIKVGYYALFKGKYRGSNRVVEDGIFIGKIKRINNSAQVVNFSHGDMFNRVGGRIFPPDRAVIKSDEFRSLDYAYFKDIIKTAKTPQEIAEPRQERLFEFIKNIVNEILFNI